MRDNVNAMDGMRDLFKVMVFGYGFRNTPGLWVEKFCPGDIWEMKLLGRKVEVIN